MIEPSDEQSDDRESPNERRPIRRILLVGSAYDAYILREAGFPSAAESRPGDSEAFDPEPPFFHVTTIAAALELLDREPVDLVITDLRHADGDAFRLGREVRARDADLPVVLLTSKQEYGRSRALVASRDDVDRVFVWHGHSGIVSAMVRTVEDARNLDHDVLRRNLRFILLVEDEPNVHSRFLPLIYREVREMTGNLLSPGLSPVERARRMRDRTRVLLVETYEDALRPLERHPHNVLGVISDIQYPHGGEIDPRAGLRLARHVKGLLRDIPEIIQSREQALQAEAEKNGAAFINKNSPHLLQTLREYLCLYFGFGDFVFRDGETGAPIAHARTLRELREVTPTVPLASFVYHGRNNHFSRWLYVHGAHDIANLLRPISGDDEPVRQQMLFILDSYT